MRIKLILPIYLIIYFINIINTEPIWKITFCNKENANITCSNPNNLTILKGNYQTIQIKIEQNNLITNTSITHIQTKLRLNHLDLKMIPNELVINTEESIEYYIELGIKCNSELNSTKLSFDIEDDDIRDLIEISECKVNLFYKQKIIFISTLNKDFITETLYGKLYLQQDFKNFEDIKIHFNCYSEYIEKIEDMIIYSYNYTYDRLIYYSIIKPNIEELKTYEKEQVDYRITASNNNKDNSKCFKIDSKAVLLSYINKTVDYGNKEAFYHNSIVSSYIDKNKDEENSLSLYFYKEVFYFVSYCAIQDINSDILSDHEILNQRLNYNNNISASFIISEIKSHISETTITFKNLDKYTNYKIKCIFDFFDNNTIELTYGEGMLIPIKINFNETKSILSKNCSNDVYIKKELDTRYCDIIDQRLIFEIFYDMNHKYKLASFNYTDFLIYSEKNQEEKIEHITNILNNNNTITSSQNELISALSDYLFQLDCQENVICQNEKDILFKKILIEYDKIDIEKIDIPNSEQSVLNDILLFNNIIQNTDSINYENFEFLVNNVLNKRNIFFGKSIKYYNHYLTNYFLLIFDKFITIIFKFKSIYKSKFIIDDKVNIYKSDLLIKFYHLFIGWISNGMINREDRLHQFCKNIFVNYVEAPFKSKIEIKMDSAVSIKGFDTEESKKLYKNIVSAGGILYKEFPLFPLDNKKSKAITFFLYTELRENFEKADVSYQEAFKIIFKKKDNQNYCYLWNNDYLKDKKEIVNNFISTEYLNEDDDSNYDINCISRIMISPMTVILGQNDIKGNLFKEGINFFSIIVIILITICLIIASLPFFLSKYYRKKSDNNNNAANELI